MKKANKKIHIKSISRRILFGVFCLPPLMFAFIHSIVRISIILWGSYEIGEPTWYNHIITVIGNLIFSFVAIIYLIPKTFYKITFIEDFLIAPKIADNVQKAIKVECSGIVTCKKTSNSFRQYFVFTCTENKKHRLFINHFSMKQLRQIIILIKEQGGLVDVDIDDLAKVSFKDRSKKNK